MWRSSQLCGTSRARFSKCRRWSASSPARPRHLRIYLPNMQPKTPFYLFGSVLLLGVFYFFLLSPPGNFPIGNLINIEKGSSLQKVSSTLRTNKVIRSRVAFEFFVIIFGGERRVRPAYYSFERELPVFEVAWRVSGGKFRLAPVVVTIPEGFDSHQIADAFAEKLPNFNKEEFLTLVADKEGYLFPDTYFFLNTDGTQEAITSLQETLQKKWGPLLPVMAVPGRPRQFGAGAAPIFCQGFLVATQL